MVNKRLVNTVKGSMVLVWKNVAVQWVALLCNMAIIFTIGYLLSTLLNSNFTGISAFIGLLFVLACVALRFLSSVLSAKLSLLASEKVKLQLRHDIYEKLLLLGPRYHQKMGTSQVVQMAVEGVDQLETYFGKYLPQLFYSLLAPLTLFVVLAFISLPSAGVLLVCVPLIPLSIMGVQKFAKKLLSKYWGSYTSLGDGFLENLQGLTTLKIYGSDEAKSTEMNQQAESFRRITMKVLIMQLNSVTLMDLIAYGGAALGIVVAITQLVNGNIGFWGCFCIILLASEFFIPLRLLGSYFHIAMNGMAASEKIFTLLDMPVEMAGNIQQLDISKGIQMNSVVCRYDNSRTILKEVNFAAGKGITAVVGESGCGKSTLAALVCGKIAASGGEVLLGGIRVEQIAPQTLAGQITLVPHNAFLFKGSVRQNLLMADAEATDEQLWDVLRLVKLDQFVKMEQGLNTLLEEQGANFSGGQRQRLALARALLHDSPMYVFDEATSNIDPESENDIMEVIWEMGRTKTVLVITHRLANAVAADGIYMLKNGRVIEQGKHETLLAQKGEYSRMYLAQRGLENRNIQEVAHG